MSRLAKGVALYCGDSVLSPSPIPLPYPWEGPVGFVRILSYIPFSKR